MIRNRLLYPYFIFLFWLAVIFFSKVHAQPNIDIISFNSQHFTSQYKDSTGDKIYTQDNFLSLFAPIKFGKGHVFMLRINGEQLSVTRSDSVKLNYTLYSVGLPIGLQLQSKNEKWKYAAIFVAKYNSDFKDNLDYDLQFGGIALVTRVINPKLQVRLGLYCNGEFWRTAFVPLIGVDWKVNDKFRMYGTMPGYYRFEYKLAKKIYTGLGFRSAQRSFRLQAKYDDDFVRIRENQLKLFFEGFVVGKILLGVEAYYGLGYSLIRYDYFKTKTEKPGLNVFTKSKNGFGVVFNLAYRIRID